VAIITGPSGGIGAAAGAARATTIRIFEDLEMDFGKVIA